MKQTLIAAACVCLSLFSFAQVSRTQVQSLYQSKMADFGLKEKDISDFVITDQYKDQSTGVTHIYLRQKVNGIEVFDANSSIHLDKNGNVIAFHNRFVAAAQEKATVSTPTIQPSAAIQNVATAIGMKVPQAFSKAGDKLVNNELVINEASVSSQPVKAKLYYLKSAEGLKLTWNVELYDAEHNDWWNTRVDAVNGTIINKNNWVIKCDPDLSPYHDRYTETDGEAGIVKANDIQRFNKQGDNGTYNILPMPLESPNHGSRELVEGTPTSNASPFGWHDVDGQDGADYTITRGNNVYASEDTLATDMPGYSPDGGSSLVFDYPYNMMTGTSEFNLDAAITNLFYWNNLVHDVFYNYGFDEEAGNFQANNYGKGGTAGDAVFADAQDGSGTNNANFQVPPDGTSGRMQMYLWPLNGQDAGNFVINNTQAAGAYASVAAEFSAAQASTITANAVLVDDGSTHKTYGCNTLLNDLTGKIALIDRGTCTSVTKVLNAQAAGAVAAIIINNTTAAPYMLTGQNSSVSIPVYMIAKATGDLIKAQLAIDSTVNISLVIDLLKTAVFDSDMDNAVITHEYGHGISTRLTGGPANSNCLFNEEQEGEGWSDFFALCLTGKVTDSTLGRGIGTWLIHEPVTGLGIRDFKYSRNMTINPSTYNTIKSLSVPHGVGSVWCTMLYDIYWDMIDKYGFNTNVYDNTSGGNNMTLQLVVDGLKLQPCSPGFVDSRDAIILADSLRYGGANKELLWKAFSRRGLGWSADQGSSDSRSDGVEAYDMPSSGSTGLAQVNAWSQIRMAPNPAQSEVYLILPDQVKSMTVELFDITGKNLLSDQFHSDGNSRIRLDLQSFAKGIYFIRATDGRNVFQSKLLIR